MPLFVNEPLSLKKNGPKDNFPGLIAFKNKRVLFIVPLMQHFLLQLIFYLASYLK